MAVAGSLFVRISAQTNRFHDRMDRAERSLYDFARTSRSVGRTVKNSFAALIPAISPIGVAAAAAVAGLSSSFAAAGIGAAAFGAVAIPILSDVFTAVEEGGDAFNKLSGSQLKAAKALQSFQSFWADFVKQFETPVLDTFTVVLDSLQKMFKLLEPTIHNVAAVVNQLANEFNAALGNAQPFFDWLEANAAEAIYNFAHIAGNTLAGFFNLMQAFSPIGASMEEGLLNLTKRFREWSASLKGSEGFQKFLDYVRATAPTVLGIIQQLGILFVNLMKGMAPMGAVLLPIVENVLNLANALLELNPYIISIIAGFFGLRAAISGVTAALGLITSPITAIILGIVALSSIFMYFFKTNEQFRANVLKIWNTVKTFLLTTINQITTWFQTYWPMIKNTVIQAFQQIWAFLQPIVMAIVNFIMTQFQAFQTWWNQHGAMIMQAAQKVWGWISSFISKTTSVIVKIFQKAWPYISSLVESVWGNIKGIISGALGVIRSVIQIFAAAVTGNWSKLWQGIKNLVKNGLQLVWNLFNLFLIGRALKLIGSFGKGAIQAITSLFKRWVSAAKSNVSKFVSSIKGGIDKALNFIRGFDDAFYKAGKGLVEMMAKGIKKAVGNVVSAVKSVAQAARNFLPFSPAKEGPLKDLDRLNFAGPIRDSILKGLPKVQAAMQQLLTLPTLAQPSVVDNSDNSSVNVYVEQLVVREEADIRKISQQLYQLQRRSSRAVGVN